MEDAIWATPLYAFLRQCNASPLPRVVLDFGAGGSQPPLSLFYQVDYTTYGVEIAAEPLKQAQQFCAQNDMTLNIIGGDMRHLPFNKERFSFVYSYNAIDFMTKPDIAISMREITRVLKPEGLCTVNFLSVDDAESWEPFCETAQAKDLLKSKEFAHFEDQEADAYFDTFEILLKEKRLVSFVGERMSALRNRFCAGCSWLDIPVGQLLEPASRIGRSHRRTHHYSIRMRYCKIQSKQRDSKPAGRSIKHLVVNQAAQSRSLRGMALVW